MPIDLSLRNIHVFPSNESFEQNFGSVNEGDLSLVPFDGIKTINGVSPDKNGNINVGLPLGHFFAWPFQTPPDGAIACNGTTYSRAVYSDFYTYIHSKGWVKTESEWNSIANSNNGYCPWYSDGDGSTTFRTPKFAPFMQIAIANTSVGTYHKAGLPDIYGKILGGGNQGSDSSYFSGAFSRTSSGPSKTYGAEAGREYCNNTASFYASRYNSIYGRSSTVQPESNEWMICVVVALSVTNLGNIDVGTISTITASYSSSTSWFRVWSDGFIEQGGFSAGTSSESVVTISFPKAYKDEKTVFVNCNNGAKMESTSDWHSTFEPFDITTSSFSIRRLSTSRSTGTKWYSVGY